MTLYRRAVAFLARHTHYCVASHISPDGDAIGSTLALGIGLLQMGKQVTCYNSDGVPRNLRFLPQTDRIVSHLGRPEAIDALVLVDCAQPKRAGEAIVALATRLPPFLIDHHILSQIDPESHCLDPQAAATGEVIYHILQAMGTPITPEIASLVYTTLVTDTGQFQYSNTTSDVLRLAAELVGRGADPWHIASALTEQQHPAAMELLRLMLETLVIGETGQWAHVTISQEMLREAQALPEYAEDFINYPRAIAGVEVAGLFRELPDGRWKVSLRSKRTVDVAALAAQFDGGGHEHAAGCTLTGDLASVRTRVESVVFAALRQIRHY